MKQLQFQIFLMDEGREGKDEHTIVKDMLALYGSCVKNNNV